MSKRRHKETIEEAHKEMENTNIYLHFFAYGNMLMVNDTQECNNTKHQEMLQSQENIYGMHW